MSERGLCLREIMSDSGLAVVLLLNADPIKTPRESLADELHGPHMCQLIPGVCVCVCGLGVYVYVCEGVLWG